MTESSIRLPIARSLFFILFYIFTVLLVPRCPIVCEFRPFVFTYCVCVCALATFIYIYIFIHSYFMWWFMERKITDPKWVMTKMSDGRWSEPLSFLFRHVNRSAHSCGAGVYTGTNMFSQQWRENMFLWCNKIPDYYISVIQAKPHEAACCYIECFVLRKDSLGWCWQRNHQRWSAQEEFCQGGWNTDCYWVSFNLHYGLHWLIATHTASNHVPIRSMFIITAQLWLKHSDAKSKESKRTRLDVARVAVLSFNTSH